MIVFNSNPPADGTAPGGRPFARGNQIYSIEADGSDLTRLTNNHFTDLHPVWEDTRPAIYNDVWGSAAVLFPGSFQVTSEDFLVRPLSWVSGPGAYDTTARIPVPVPSFARLHS